MKEERPLIISASRRTDIPAFYMKDFLKMWRSGRTVWRNPFNPNQRKIVLFDRTRLVVFWSKYPVGIIGRFDELDFNYYVLYTLNDYPEVELGLPPLDRRIELFEELSRRVGRYRVVWRFDPIILLKGVLEEDEILRRFENILKRLSGKTFRVIISFFTPYRKSVSRLKKAGYDVVDLDADRALRIAKNLADMAREEGLEIQSCADRFNADGTLERVGIKKGACIDPELVSIAFDDPELLEGLKHLGKDRGQRKECLCLESVDVGEYRTCRFRCLYCYAI